MSALHLLTLCLLALPITACNRVEQPAPAPAVTYYPNGQWFVPANSGLGAPRNLIKAFVLYDGTVCLTVSAAPGPVSSLNQITGLICVPKVAK